MYTYFTVILLLFYCFKYYAFFSFLFASSRREESTEDGMKRSKEKKKNRHIIRYSGIVTNFVYLCISLNFSLFTFIYNFRFILLSIEHTKYTNSIPARIDFIKDSRVRIDMKWKKYDTHQSIWITKKEKKRIKNFHHNLVFDFFSLIQTTHTHH